MIQKAPVAFAGLYEDDETAWIEAMAALIAMGRFHELDYVHLGEYLSDMAISDRRQVENRLAVLLTQVLKWLHQPDKRTPSWPGTIVEQRQRSARQVRKGVLRLHAEASLEEVYADAVERAVADTELPVSAFPAECPYTLDQLLAPNLLGR